MMYYYSRWLLPSATALCRRALVTSATHNALPSMTAGQLGKKVAKAGKLGSPTEKTVLPVETDPHRLVQYCCGSNILIEGEDIQLAPDSDYPDWLWELDTSAGHAALLLWKSLSPDSLQYWWLVRNKAIRRQNQLLAKKKLKG
ncbi:39S ribosomal protein L54, mitochondrial-like [Pollicipes pollicipes]|uniref:39S ribosomal protein L54, mitochondrial-like n=1 Tax=Pollicipes pollicipes TaxID=41117 RepID=UPI001884D2A4|nr:39S ribosomal protein L54, mitochondrial-like [Pollicipes pollicipes]